MTLRVFVEMTCILNMRTRLQGPVRTDRRQLDAVSAALTFPERAAVHSLSQIRFRSRLHRVIVDTLPATQEVAFAHDPRVA